MQTGTIDLAAESLGRRIRGVHDRLRGVQYRLGRALRGAPSQLVELRSVSVQSTSVDAYWTGHTVNSTPFRSPRASERYLEWRFGEYPLFRQFMGLSERHDGQVVLDHGCGPANDLTGLLLYSGAARVIGVDASLTALRLARSRLALHQIAPGRCELVHCPDGAGSVPLGDASVDYIHSVGVLHHTSEPQRLLHEFARVLRPGGTGRIMVYNRDSVWFHLYTAYERMILEGAFPGIASVEDAFRRNTDGPLCPISRCYRAEEFTEMCHAAGLRAEWLGGYLSQRELQSLRDSWVAALVDGRLDAEHRGFLRSLTFDFNGYPMYRDRHAGIGNVFRFSHGHMPR
jgi:ubiquinone/menaquinone biosynthesis C-methylase UbiE